jgi:hypothetical protein
MRQPVDADRLRAFMKALAREARGPLQVYLVGGSTAVLEGWREATIDVDLAFGENDDAVLRALPRLKEAFDINVELASPADFIPMKPGWQDRSPFVTQEGVVTFRHFDLYAQALAKIERGHETDRGDVREMLARGLVTGPGLLEYFGAIEPELYRFPAIDPVSFRNAVTAVVSQLQSRRV